VFLFRFQDLLGIETIQQLKSDDDYSIYESTQNRTFKTALKLFYESFQLLISISG
jgi:hypothetical protein